MNKLDKDYINLIKNILENGTPKSDRTGTGTLSLFNTEIRHRMEDGFPLLTTKKLNFKNIWTELVWFLKGDSNIRFLLKNGNDIWLGDAYKNYQMFYDHVDGPNPLGIKEFKEKILTDDYFNWKWGDLGPIYGPQWRNATGVDQIERLIDDLKSDPDSRRLMVSAWDVANLHKMVLPPCHYGFQVYTRLLSESERFRIFSNKVGTDVHHDRIEQEMDDLNIPKREISLKWNQRSVDTGLGLPYNIASYGMLLMMIGDEVNMVPGELSASLGDTHIYKNHIEGLKEQIKREPRELPKLSIADGIFSNCEGDFLLTDYNPHPHIKLNLSN